MHLKAEQQQFFESIGDVDLIQQLIGNLLTCIPGLHYVIKDVSGRFMMMDDAFLRKLHLKSKRELLGKTDYDLFPKDVAEGYVKDDQYVIENRKALLNRIEVIPSSQKLLEWWVTSKYPVFNLEGEIIGIAAITSRTDRVDMPSVQNPEMQEVVLYISKHYGSAITLDDLSKVAKMSERTFIRHFRKCYNTSPLKYVSQARLNAACHDLIYSHEGISEIAFKCGFFDQSHLTREFRAKFNITPLGYRKRHRAFSGINS